MGQNNSTMVAITVEDLIAPAMMTLLAGFQIGNFAKAVGKARGKHKVYPPACTGPEEFNLIFRAYSNCCEFFPLFLALVWVSGLFTHPLVCVGGSLMYVYGRQKYFTGYSQDAKKRMPGFRLSVNAITFLAAASGIGISLAALRHYAGLDLVAMAMSKIRA